MSVNPYEPPMGESFDPKAIAELAEVDRDGSSLVVLVAEEKAHLPARCVLTGGTANIRKHTAYVDASTRAVMARQLRFSMRFVPVEYWLTEDLAAKQAKRERHGTRICLLAGAGILASFAMVAVATVTIKKNSLSTDQQTLYNVVLAVLVLSAMAAFLVAGFYLAGILHGPFSVVRVLGRRIWLGGASKEFLDAIDLRNANLATSDALIDRSTKVP